VIKVPKLPRVRTRVLTTIETRARLKAEAAFKKSPQGLEKIILDMMDRIDPLELLAVFSGTFVVYDIVKSVPELLAGMKSFLFHSPISLAFPLANIIISRIWGDQELTTAQKEEFKKIREELDPILFVKSFFMAYILVKHSGQIIAGVGNVTGFIAGFLGLKIKQVLL